MSYKGKIQYLDLNKLPRPDKRFSVGRILAQGHCAKICEAIDHENGTIHLLFFPPAASKIFFFGWKCDF